MKKALLALLVFTGLSRAQVYPPQQAVRMSFIFPTDPATQWTAIHPEFLDRARKNDFNYILGQFELSTHYWNVDGGYNPTFVNDLKNAFLAVNAHGMRLIPHFQFGTKHASRSLASINTNISWNILGHGPCTGPARAICPGGYINNNHAYAPDPPGKKGVDYVYKQLMLGIRAASEAANLPPPDYIHIGHDEPVAGWGVHPLDAPGTAPHGLLDTLLAGNSVPDSIFLARAIANGTREATEDAFHRLMASELERRILQTDSVFGGATRLMVWGDMYDNQHAGGELRAQLYNHHLIRTEGILQKVSPALRSRLVIIPWIYQTNYPYGLPDSVSDYNTDSTFARLQGAGYEFLFAGQAGDDGDPSRTFGDDRNWSLGPGAAGMRQLGEYVHVMQDPAFRTGLIGFSSNQFRGYGNGPSYPVNDYRWTRHGPPWNFRTMEYLSNWAVFHAAIFD